MVVVILPQLRSGGTEWQTVQLLRSLSSSRRCLVWVYTAHLANPQLLAELRAMDGVELATGGFAAIRGIARRRPSLIISYAINFYLWEIVLKLLSGAVLVTERRNLYQWLRGQRRRYFQECVRNLLTRVVVCNSGAVARRAAVVERFVSAKIRVIPNALGMTPPAGNIDAGRVVAVCNIKAGKGVLQMLRSFDIARSETNAADIRFELFGRLDDPSILSSADEEIVASFYKGEGDRNSIYSGAICIVHLSEAEGFPNVVLEAMAHGAVPVLSDIEVHRELFSGAAIFVKDGDAAAHAIASLLSERASRPAQFADRRQLVRDTALGFSESSRGTAYEQIIADCLD